MSYKYRDKLGSLGSSRADAIVPSVVEDSPFDLAETWRLAVQTLIPILNEEYGDDFLFSVPSLLVDAAITVQASRAGLTNVGTFFSNLGDYPTEPLRIVIGNYTNGTSRVEPTGNEFFSFGELLGVLNNGPDAASFGINVEATDTALTFTSSQTGDTSLYFTAPFTQFSLTRVFINLKTTAADLSNLPILPMTFGIQPGTPE